jgi:hypothetical protein
MAIPWGGPAKNASYSNPNQNTKLNQHTNRQATAGLFASAALSQSND